MGEGTYADESPDAGIGERVANSVRKIAQAIMPHKEPVTMGGNNPANKEAADEAGVESNTGRSGQSTDAYNKY